MATRKACPAAFASEGPKLDTHPGPVRHRMLAMELAAESDISCFSAAELLRMDSKEYEVGGTKFRVSVLETTSPETVLARNDALIEDMGAVAEDDGVDQVLFFVVDILNEESLFFVPNDVVKSIAEKSFGITVKGSVAALPGVVSRKSKLSLT
jgi:manganese-dependent inorganic pyrophosphatase